MGKALRDVAKEVGGSADDGGGLGEDDAVIGAAGPRTACGMGEGAEGHHHRE